MIANAHLKQFEHNKNFIKYRISDYKNESFHDWEITVTFYAVIHLIEAVLSNCCKVENVLNHENRFSEMCNNPRIFDKRIMMMYTSLKNLSNAARYNGVAYVEINDAKKAQEYLEDLEIALITYLKIN